VKVLLILGINDPQIWLAYVFCILSALGCMIYGVLHWTEKDEGKVIKSNGQKPVKQGQ
jgi:hypothetical protein